MRTEMILQKSVTEFKTCKNDRFSPIQGSPYFVLCPAKWFTFCPHTLLYWTWSLFEDLWRNTTLFSSQWYHEIFHIIGLLEDCGRPLFIWHALHDKIFHKCPSPTHAHLFRFCFTYQIPLILFLGWEHGLEGPTTQKTVFWLFRRRVLA